MFVYASVIEASQSQQLVHSNSIAVQPSIVVSEGCIAPIQFTTLPYVSQTNQYETYVCGDQENAVEGVIGKDFRFLNKYKVYLRYLNKNK